MSLSCLVAARALGATQMLHIGRLHIPWSETNQEGDPFWNLFHELKHAAGYGSQVDAPSGLTGAQTDQFWANEYQTNAQNCSPQQVQMQTSDVGGTIQ